ncbi:MAG: MFS transporter [Acidimicrobiales bacterium]
MPRPPGQTTAWSLPDFRRVWIGTTISAAGDAASWVALVALSLGALHANLVLLVAFYTAPVAVGGLAAGWALDRFDRRRLMILDNLIRGAAFASIPLAAVFAPLQPAQLYAVAATYGLLKMVSLAGFPSLIPSLVPEDHLDQANALEGASFGVASLVGAALAGVAVATIGAVHVMVFDAASYLVLVLSLASVRNLKPPTADPRPARPASAPSRSLSAIVRLVASTPALRDTTIMFALFNVGEGALLVFLPHRAVALGLGRSGYGYLVAATTGGELVAAAYLARHTWRHPLRSSIVCAQVAAALVVVMLAVHSSITTVVALVGLGIFSAPMTAWAQSLRMRLVEADAHGRLFALLRTAMQATPPLGAGLAALILTHGTLVTVAVVAGVMGLPALTLARHLLQGADIPIEPPP